MTENDRNQYLMSAAAIAMSAIAMVLTFFELRASDRQLDANVWPYVDTAISLNADTFELTVSNKGLGPALIHEYRLFHDGTEVSQAADFLALAGYRQTDLSLTTGSVPNTVLAVGESITALRIAGDGVGFALRDIVSEVEIEICYCAINGACWNNYAGSAFRDRVESCQIQSMDVNDALRMLEASGPVSEP
jgi:hypothetical protein